MSEDEAPQAQRTLTIDWDGLRDALTSDIIIEWYFDLHTGRLLMRADDLDEVSDAFEDDLERFVQVFPLSSREKWHWREAFAREQPEGPVRDRLLDALEGQDAFRHFKNAVRGEGLEDAWHAWEADCLQQAARHWLARNDIEPSNPPPASTA